MRILCVMTLYVTIPSYLPAVCIYQLQYPDILTAVDHSNGEIRWVSGADGFRTFHTVKVCVFRRLRARGKKFPHAGGAGRGVSVASGFAPVRRPVRAPAVKLVPETKRFGSG